MKKLLFIGAILLFSTLISCGGDKSTNNNKIIYAKDSLHYYDSVFDSNDYGYNLEYNIVGIDSCINHTKDIILFMNKMYDDPYLPTSQIYDNIKLLESSLMFFDSLKSNYILYSTDSNRVLVGN